MSPKPPPRFRDHYADGAWYDAEYVHIGGDIPYYEQVACETDGPILELACGTGRLTFPMAATGVKVVGVDNSTAMLARAEAKRAALPPSGRRAALYGPNGYTSGTETLSGEILTAAGWRNVAADLGLRWGGNVPLERMVMAAPDLLISGDRYNGASQAEALLDHPALAAIPRAAIEGGDWTCGTPAVLRAIRRLREAAP